MLRNLRGPDGGPSRVVRLIAILVALTLVLGAATALIPALRWLVGLL